MGDDAPPSSMPMPKEPHNERIHDDDALDPPDYGPSDVELFREAMGAGNALATTTATSADFSRAAKDKLANGLSGRGHADDIEFEREMGENFVDLFTEIVEAARVVEADAVDPDSKFRRNINTQRLMLDGLDLIDNIHASDRPGTRGNLFDIASQLIDATYFVGKWAEASPSRINEHVIAKQANDGRKGKAISGPKLTAKTLLWKGWVESEVKKKLRVNRTLSTDELTTKIDTMSWPPGIPQRSRSSVLRFLQQLHIPQKLSDTSWLEDPAD